MENLGELVYDLDNELGSIVCRIEILSDIKDLLMLLRDDVDTAVYRGNEKFYFREFHQQIRVLSELMWYTTNELSKEYEKTHETKNKLFENVVKTRKTTILEEL